MVARLRGDGCDVPLVLMGYMNPIVRMGVESFVARSAEAGVDGFIVPDLPLEEADPLGNAAAARGLALVLLAAPTPGAPERAPASVRERTTPDSDRGAVPAPRSFDRSRRLDHCRLGPAWRQVTGRPPRPTGPWCRGARLPARRAPEQGRRVALGGYGRCGEDGRLLVMAAPAPTSSRPPRRGGHQDTPRVPPARGGADENSGAARARRAPDRTDR